MIRRPSMRRWLISTTALAGVLTIGAPLALANPEGGVVTQGSATITQPDAKTVQVNQTSNRAVIDWRSFSIAADELTRFNQPSSSAIALNRVTGDQVSQILGRLQANGQIVLVNPNGIVFGADSKIDVGALIASTANIKTENFMAGNMKFDIPGKPNAQIINHGTITAADGGLVAIVSPYLRNSGIIVARLGKVGLAAANGATLDLYGDNLILFQASDKITNQLVGLDGKPVATQIESDGKIYADGGRVLLTANVAKGVVDNAINTTGLISARAVEQQGGEIVLKGEDAGIVQVSGSLDASGKDAGQKGGRVSVQGDSIALLSGAKVDTSGDTGGGNVDVGNWQSTAARMESGASIDASAQGNGNAGNITMISANTDAAGTFLARGGANGGDGGQVETSGHFLRVANAKVDAYARKGKAGRWFLDPYDITIDAAAATSIGSTLDNGTDVVLQTNLTGASGGLGTVNGTGNGDITIASALGWTGGGNLSLSAYRNIQINAAVTHGGSGLLFLTPDNASTGTGNVLTGENGYISFPGSGGLQISGQGYTLIRTAQQLQNINMAGRYVLAQDIDLSTTTNFSPIGYTSTNSNDSPSDFTGTFDGLGHIVSGLHISADYSRHLGLFSSTGVGSELRNVYIENAEIETNRGWFIGILAGRNYGIITNTYATGRISGDSFLGGLVGYNYSGNISKSFAAVDVTGVLSQNTLPTGLGGLVGVISTGTVSESYASGSVSGGQDSFGGLVGANYGLVSNSYATGTVTGSDSGSIFRGGSHSYGGLIGRNSGTVSNSYSTGYIQNIGVGDWAPGVYGGFSGQNWIAISSFWDVDTSGQLIGTASPAPHTSGITGITSRSGSTAFDSNTYLNAGWSPGIWKIINGIRPTLKNVAIRRAAFISNSGVVTGSVSSPIIRVNNSAEEHFIGVTRTVDIPIFGTRNQSYGFLIDGHQEIWHADGSVDLNIPVYNNRSTYVSFEIIDKDGNVIGTELAEPKLLSTSAVDFYKDMFLGLFDGNSGFKDNRYSSQTDISLHVPAGGKVRASYDSNVAITANFATQLIDVLASHIELADDKSVIKRQMKTFIQELVNANLSSALKSTAEGVLTMGDFLELLADKMDNQGVNSALADSFSAMFPTLAQGDKRFKYGFAKLAATSGLSTTTLAAEAITRGLNLADAIIVATQDQSQFSTTITPSQ